MSADYEVYEELKLTFKCRRCDAEPGMPCHDKHGRKSQFDHASRNDQAWFLIGLALNPPTELQLAHAKRLAAEWNF